VAGRSRWCSRHWSRENAPPLNCHGIGGGALTPTENVTGSSLEPFGGGFRVMLIGASTSAHAIEP